MSLESNNARQMGADRARIERSLKMLSDTSVAELVRRAGKREIVRTSTKGIRASKGTHSDPTLTAVIASASDEKKASDIVFETVQNIARHLRDMAELAALVEQGISFVFDAQERVKVAQITHCEACRREVMNTPNDRLRSGYCGACYQAWIRAGRPYRLTFEVSVRNRAQERHQSAGESSLAASA